MIKLTEIEVPFINVIGSSQDKSESYGFSSWIDYYNHNKIFKLKKCACCNKNPTPSNPIIGGHVLAEVEKKWDLYIVPICNKCNLKYGKIETPVKFFMILRMFLCPHPNPTAGLENINIEKP